MSPPDPSVPEIETLLREARQQRSQALGAALSRLFLAPGRLMRRLRRQPRPDASAPSPLTPPARS